MPHYNIKFELYGKKMQTTIQGDSVWQAEKNLRDKIIIHETKRINYPHDNFIMDIFNGWKKK